MKNFDDSYELLEVVDGQLTTITVSRAARLTSQDNQFRLNGETFTVRPGVAPEAILDYYRMLNGELGDLKEEQALQIFDQTVLAFLEPGQEEAWRRARRPDCDNPVTVADIRGVVQWLIERQSGRPTSPPSGSTPGSSATEAGTQSTGASSWRAAEEPQP